jgi:hypothetical protein
MKQGNEGARNFCEQCGLATRAAARFCGGCGFDMTAVPRVGPVADLEMGAAEHDGQETGNAISMGLGMAWLIYLGAMVLWLGVMLLPNRHLTGMLALVVHCGLGFVMTRYVMDRLIEFHPVHNTIANVFSAKLWMFLLWPLRMPVLLFKLTVNSSL